MPTATPATSEISQPTIDRFSGPAADPLEVDLVAGQEEQHRQTEVGELVGEVGRLHPAQDRRADQQAEHDLEDDQRDPETRPISRGQQRCECGGQRDADERCQADVSIANLGSSGQARWPGPGISRSSRRRP